MITKTTANTKELQVVFFVSLVSFVPGFVYTGKQSYSKLARRCSASAIAAVPNTRLTLPIR